MVITQEVIQSIAAYALTMATTNDGVKRNKAFKFAFERVETNYGKMNLTDDVKSDLRNAIDEKLKSLFVLGEGEVVTNQAAYLKLNSEGKLIRGNRFTTEHTKSISVEAEIVKLHRLFLDLRTKISKSENGATEGQLRSMRKLKNAINARLFEHFIQVNRDMDDTTAKIYKFMQEQASKETVAA